MNQRVKDWHLGITSAITQIFTKDDDTTIFCSSSWCYINNNFILIEYLSTYISNPRKILDSLKETDWINHNHKKKHKVRIWTFSILSGVDVVWNSNYNVNKLFRDVLFACTVKLIIKNINLDFQTQLPGRTAMHRFDRTVGFYF